MPGVMGRHVHRHHEVHRDSIGAHLGLEAHQELGAQHVKQQGHRPVIGRSRAAGTRRAEPCPDANPDLPARGDRGNTEHQPVDCSCVPRSEGNQRNDEAPDAGAGDQGEHIQRQRPTAPRSVEA